jgi:hypothetical protein
MATKYAWLTETNLRRAIACIPRAELELWQKLSLQVEKMGGPPIGQSNWPTDEYLQRRIIAFTHFANPICDKCEGKGLSVPLFPCPGCFLRFYCSPQCQKAAEAKHSKECGNLDAPFCSDDPYAPALIECPVLTGDVKK